MKITYNWLKEYIDFAWDHAELVDRLTMSGLEQESVEDLGKRYRGVVVGEVLECVRHPNADRLKVCKVGIGSTTHTIVCGAANAAAGKKVPVILPGHSLPDGTRIGKSSIRGVESAGMICSEVELDLGADASGIIELPPEMKTGKSFASQMGLDDVVIDFEVTPNRPDCLSVFGIAREVGALADAELRLPPHSVAETGPPISCSVSIEIDDPQSCRRYVGRVLRNVRVGPSPPWLQMRLRAVGQRPINNVVDITNFVLLELGHPLHAFDLNKLEDSRIVVRRAKQGEVLETLDGVRRELTPEILVVADGKRAVAAAGIMGGVNSEVTEETVDILLESAYFSASRVRRAKSLLGINTEASMRFERGADFAIPPLAIDRAANLISALCGCQVAPGRLDVCPAPLPRTRIRARVGRINRLLNTDLDPGTVCRILRRLGCEVEREGEILTVAAPSFRPDLQREVDLVEEVGRIHGYEHIVPSSSAGGPLGTAANPPYRLQGIIRHRLAGLGLDEVVSNPIIEGKWLELLEVDPDSVIQLANPPAEDQGIMRPTLVPSLLDIARRNFNQRAPTVAIFELGKCFAKSREALRLAALWSGRSTASSWQADHREVEIWDLKGLLETFLDFSPVSFAPANHPQFRRGQGAQVRIGDQPVGFLGTIAPALSKAFDIERPVHIFDLDFQSLAQHWNPHGYTFRPLPKFPPVERDLAIVLDDGISGADVVAQIRATAPQLIETVEPFALYRGDQIAAGRKSLTFSIRLRSGEKTLKDEDADKVMEAILNRLRNAFGAELR